jgi:5-methyltetrahydrofolate--homocysteine methyltransferase|tara:strand:- start:1401 stop:2051 length:651 start_codon:yes stop_codon:yes gene_type:complete
MPDLKLFDRLKELVVTLDANELTKAVQDAFAGGILPQDIISKGLAKGMEEIGERFEEREIFLPELLRSAKAMQSALDVLRPHLTMPGDQSAGKIVLGTVQGDVHDIGKNIVGAVLEGNRFEVYDLGEDVSPEEFAKKAQEVKADVIGMSALISLAVSKMSETFAILKEKDIPAKVILGGAAVTQEGAEKMGADAYGKDAWEALRQIRQMRKGGSWK